MVFNGAAIRDTARILKAGINTVIRTLKTLATASNFISGGSCWRSAYLRTRRAMEFYRQ